MLPNLGSLWHSASVRRRNRLLRTMLNAIYVGLDARKAIGLAPKETFFSPIMAMTERKDVAVVSGDGNVLVRMVETGEAAPSGSLSVPVRVVFKTRKSAYPSLADCLRAKGEQLGLSQAELAQRIGVSVQTIKGWESGSQSPRAGNRGGRAEVLGHDVYACGD